MKTNIPLSLTVGAIFISAAIYEGAEILLSIKGAPDPASPVILGILGLAWIVIAFVIKKKDL